MTSLDLAPATLAALTMPQVLKRRADAHPDQLALREKDPVSYTHLTLPTIYSV